MHVNIISYISGAPKVLAKVSLGDDGSYVTEPPLENQFLTDMLDDAYERAASPQDFLRRLPSEFTGAYRRAVFVGEPATPEPKTLRSYQRKLVALTSGRARRSVNLGGPGSGNFGHSGRPGEVGGSSDAGQSGPDGVWVGSGKNARLVSRSGETEVMGNPDVSSFMKGHEWATEAVQAFAKEHGAAALVDAARWYNNKQRGPGSYYGDKLIDAMNAARKGIMAEKRKSKGVAIKQMKVKVVAALKERGFAIGDTVYDRETGTKGKIEFDKDGSPIIISDLGNRHAFGKRWQKPTNLGGPGSGNFGHAGRPGEIGGSSSDGGSDSGTDDGPSWPYKDGERRVSPKADEVAQTFLNWNRDLSDSERDALSKYTAEAYQDINRTLRGVDIDGDWDSNDLTKWANDITAALDRAPKPPPPAVVYRGVSGQRFANLKPGDVIRMDGFQSTSIDPVVARNWSGVAYGDNAGTMFEIKPTQGAYVAESSSAGEDEKEFLLPHGRYYRVVGKDRVFLDQHDVNTPIVKLEMLPSFDVPAPKRRQDARPSRW